MFANIIYYSQPKRKHTKRLLAKIYYSPQSKSSISLEVVVETKPYPDSALGNSLCTSGCKPKSEKKLFFSWPPMHLEIELLPNLRRGCLKTPASETSYYFP